MARTHPPALPAARIPGVEGLRAIACLAVLTGHTWSESGAGRQHLEKIGRPTDLWSLIDPALSSGLTLFFTLSGFLLWRPFAAAMLAGDHLPDTRAYLRSRALRILPAYWVILCLTAAAGLAITTVKTQATGSFRDPTSALLNVLLLQGYTPGTVLTGITPAWSLSVEVVFYLLLVPLAGATFAFARTRRAPCRAWIPCLPAVGLAALGLVGKQFQTQPFIGGATWAEVLARSFATKADLFAAGMIAAVLVAAVGRQRMTAPTPRRLMRFGVALFAVASVSMPSLGWAEMYYPDVVSLACASVVLAVAVSPDSARAITVLEWRPVCFLGVISYSVYLAHDPVIHWLAARGLFGTSPPAIAGNLALVLAVTIPVSTVVYRFAEAPALRRRRSARASGRDPVVGRPLASSASG